MRDGKVKSEGKDGSFEEDRETRWSCSSTVMTDFKGGSKTV